MREPEDQGGCYGVASPGNVRSYTLKVSPGWLPQPELNKDNSNRQAKTDREKSKWSQLYTKNDRQLRDAEGRRNSLPQKRAHQLVIQHQMVSTENVHASSIIQNEYMVWEHIYICICV